MFHFFHRTEVVAIEHLPFQRSEKGFRYSVIMWFGRLGKRLLDLEFHQQHLERVRGILGASIAVKYEAKIRFPFCIRGPER